MPFCLARCLRIILLRLSTACNSRSDIMVLFPLLFSQQVLNEVGHDYGKYLCNLWGIHPYISVPEAGGRKLSLPQGVLKMEIVA